MTRGVLPHPDLDKETNSGFEGTFSLVLPVPAPFVVAFLFPTPASGCYSLCKRDIPKSLILVPFSPSPFALPNLHVGHREILSPEEIEKLADEEKKAEIRKRREFEKMRAEEAKADSDNKTQVSTPLNFAPHGCRGARWLVLGWSYYVQQHTEGGLYSLPFTVVGGIAPRLGLLVSWAWLFHLGYVFGFWQAFSDSCRPQASGTLPHHPAPAN